jgi:hypothetical protein
LTERLLDGDGYKAASVRDMTWKRRNNLTTAASNRRRFCVLRKFQTCEKIEELRGKIYILIDKTGDICYNEM